MRLDLSGVDIDALHAALRKAFDLDDFGMMLQMEANRDLEDYAGGGANRQKAIFNVIKAAEREAWTDKLVLGAAARRPDDPLLAPLLKRFGLLTSTSDGRLAIAPILQDGATPGKALERIVNNAGFANIDTFISGLGRLESLVCRIERNGSPIGTGFLVAPDLVLTNYHVVELFHQQPAGVVCRFDYKAVTHRMEDTKKTETTERPGTSFALADINWLLAQSPYAEGDAREGGAPPTANELDYAIIRLAKAAGNTEKGTDILSEERPRGFIQLRATAFPPDAPAPVLLLQHPTGAPLKLSIGNVLASDLSPLRFRYNADSEGGSSGSPVVDSRLQLVGLHHAGDPNAKRIRAEYNQGIPISQIVKDLRDRVKMQPIWA
jgi:hypothetical protein